MAIRQACRAALAAAVVTVAMPLHAGTLPVGAVQGDGAHSPLLGREVTVQGVVTADFSRGLGVWVLQDGGDGNAATSDALFIRAQPGQSVRVGSQVRVRGTVAEREAGSGRHITLLEPVAVHTLPAAALPPPLPLRQLPDSEAGWERLEAMRVSFPLLTLVGVQHAREYGEWQVALGERLWVPTEIARPGSAASNVAAENRARTFWLDDGQAGKNRHTPMTRDIPRTGTQLVAVEGIVDERFSGYRVQLAAPPRMQGAAPPPAPPRTGPLRVASLNLENLFNGDGKGGGFPTARGAKTLADYRQQLQRLVNTLAALDADVWALMEMENDTLGSDSAEADLLAALNRVQGGDWVAVPLPPTASNDVIRNALLYRRGRLRLHGMPRVLDEGAFARLNRPTLAASFVAGTGERLTVVVNHLKSKSCRNAQGADADQQDGQGCWNATRRASVAQLDAFVRRHYPGQPVLLLGDFNAYGEEDPIRWLREARWHDAFSAATARPYSYVYQGQAGRLDHAFVNAALRPFLHKAQVWHVNADATAGSAGRSGDHDPLLLDLHWRR